MQRLDDVSYVFEKEVNKQLLFEGCWANISLTPKYKGVFHPHYRFFPGKGLVLDEKGECVPFWSVGDAAVCSLDGVDVYYVLMFMETCIKDCYILNIQVPNPRMPFCVQDVVLQSPPMRKSEECMSKRLRY